MSAACKSMQGKKKTEMATLFDKEPIPHNITWKTQRNGAKEHCISEEMKQILTFWKKKDLELNKKKAKGSERLALLCQHSES